MKKIQLNTLYIEMWLSSLNTFEVNQFTKKKTFNSVNLGLRLYKKGKNE